MCVCVCVCVYVVLGFSTPSHKVCSSDECTTVTVIKSAVNVIMDTWSWDKGLTIAVIKSTVHFNNGSTVAVIEDRL